MLHYVKHRDQIEFLVTLIGLQLDDCAEHFKRVLTINPDHIQARYNYGVTLLALQQPHAAITELETAAALNPGDLETRLALSQAYRYNLETDRALEILTAIKRDNPEYSAVYAELCAIYFHIGEFDQARVFCEKAVAADGTVEPGIIEKLKATD